MSLLDKLLTLPVPVIEVERLAFLPTPIAQRRLAEKQSQMAR